MDTIHVDRGERATYLYLIELATAALNKAFGKGSRIAFTDEPTFFHTTTNGTRQISLDGETNKGTAKVIVLMESSNGSERPRTISVTLERSEEKKFMVAK
jgi:hypothetical protein